MKRHKPSSHEAFLGASENTYILSHWSDGVAEGFKKYCPVDKHISQSSVIKEESMDIVGPPALFATVLFQNI